jgi:hypothetical protein
MSDNPGATGLAALSICESLLLSLTESGTIDVAEAKAILEDAATAHRYAATLGKHVQDHTDAAALIERIMKGGNSVRQV